MILAEEDASRVSGALRAQLLKSACRTKFLEEVAGGGTNQGKVSRGIRLRLDLAAMWTYYVHMKTVTVRELRNHFSKLETWLREGEQIRIEKRGQPIAVLRAIPARRGKGVGKPDFAARLKALWGERVFSQAEVSAMRAAELDGEQG